MARNSEKDEDQHDADSHPPLPKVTTATNNQRLTTSTETLTSISPSPSPPSDDSHHALLPTLPFELLVEILYWLPVKFLLQLCCVCKTWNSLISDPEFAKNHFRLSRRSHFTASHLMTSSTNSSDELVLWSSPLSSVFKAVSTGLMQTPFRYPLNFPSHFTSIVGSCDGILCFTTDVPSVIVWNPSIRKFKILPPLENQPPETSDRYFTRYGFGYDQLTDTYKVVAVFVYKCPSDNLPFDEYKTRVKVHTLGTNSWRMIQEFPKGYPLASPAGESGTFVGSTVNWLSFDLFGFSQFIMSLDLGTESYCGILLPDFGKEFKLASATLGVVRDCLCILAHSWVSAEIWIMTEYGQIESWTKLFNLPTDLMRTREISCFTKPKALYISEDDEMLLELNFQLGHMAVYNSSNGTFKVMDIQDFSCSTTSVVYMESLISPCP